MRASASEHLIRHHVLDILLRLPINDTMKAHVPAIMEAALGVLKLDNEENGVVSPPPRAPPPRPAPRLLSQCA